MTTIDQPISESAQFATLLDHLSDPACDCIGPLASGVAGIAPDTAALLSPQAMPITGQRSAIIGVIDYAIPFAHRDLTTASGHSRVAACWLQGAEPVADGTAPADLPFGREIRGAWLDDLRVGAAGQPPQSEDQIYRRTGALRTLRTGPRQGPGLAARVSHGAAITWLAAGCPPDDSMANAKARQCPLIAVSLPDHLVADTSGAFAPYFIQAAIIFIVNRARRLARELQADGHQGSVPLVINLSFGATTGPRDGSDSLVQLQDLIARCTRDELDPVHFVLPSGNHRQERLHGVIARGQAVDWQIPPDDPTPNVVEIWGPDQPAPADQPAIELNVTLPGGQVVCTDFGDARDGISCLISGGVEIARIYRQFRHISQRGGEDCDCWRQCVTVVTAPTRPSALQFRGAPSGFWQLSLASGPEGPLSIDVQRDDRLPAFPGMRRQSRLFDASYQRHDRHGRTVETDPGDTQSVLRRKGSANAYASGVTQLRVGGAIRLKQITVAEPLPPAPGSPRVALYAGLLDTGSPGDLLAQSDRSELLAGVAVAGSRSGSRGVASGTSVAAPQVTRWLAEALLSGADLPDRDAVIRFARDQQARPEGQIV